MCVCVCAWTHVSAWICPPMKSGKDTKPTLLWMSYYTKKIKAVCFSKVEQQERGCSEGSGPVTSSLFQFNFISREVTSETTSLPSLPPLLDATYHVSFWCCSCSFFFSRFENCCEHNTIKEKNTTY